MKIRSIANLIAGFTYSERDFSSLRSRAIIGQQFYSIPILDSYASSAQFLLSNHEAFHARLHTRMPRQGTLSRCIIHYSMRRVQDSLSPHDEGEINKYIIHQFFVPSRGISSALRASRIFRLISRVYLTDEDRVCQWRTAPDERDRDRKRKRKEDSFLDREGVSRCRKCFLVPRRLFVRVFARRLLTLARNRRRYLLASFLPSFLTAACVKPGACVWRAAKLNGKANLLTPVRDYCVRKNLKEPRHRKIGKIPSRVLVAVDFRD